MPAAIYLGRLNQLLRSPGSDEYRSARDAVESATSCEGAANAVSLFDAEPDAAVQAEARRVLGVLIPEVEREILEVLRRALGRDDVVVFSWEATEPNTPIRIRVHEDTHRTDIVIVSPDGRTL